MIRKCIQLQIITYKVILGKQRMLLSGRVIISSYEEVWNCVNGKCKNYKEMWYTLMNEQQMTL